MFGALAFLSRIHAMALLSPLFLHFWLSPQKEQQACSGRCFASLVVIPKSLP
jgi:hypothetical protein